MLANLESLAMTTGLEKASFSFQPQRRAMPEYLNYCTIALILNAAAAKSLQSCLTLCDPINGSPPGSPIPGILQARTLEWVAISFSNAWKWKWICSVVSPRTAAYQAPVSMGFSRQDASKVILKILQARFQQYMNRQLPHVQAGFRRVIGTRD